ILLKERANGAGKSALKLGIAGRRRSAQGEAAQKKKNRCDGCSGQHAPPQRLKFIKTGSVAWWGLYRIHGKRYTFARKVRPNVYKNSRRFQSPNTNNAPP